MFDYLTHLLRCLQDAGTSDSAVAQIVNKEVADAQTWLVSTAYAAVDTQFAASRPSALMSTQVCCVWRALQLSGQQHAIDAIRICIRVYVARNHQMNPMHIHIYVHKHTRKYVCIYVSVRVPTHCSASYTYIYTCMYTHR